MSSTIEFETPRMSSNRIQFVTRFRDTSMITRVAEFEVRELRRVTKFATNVEIPSVEEMTEYLKTLLDLRVRTVTKGDLKEMKVVAKGVRVPERWYTLLANVGFASHKILKVEFTPEIAFKDFEPMSENEIKRISSLLLDYLEDGYGTIKGIPRDTHGSVQFMAKAVISEEVRGIDIESPAYGFLASLVNSEIMCETYADLSILFRVTYSSIDTYEFAFSDYFKAIETGGNIVVDAVEGIAQAQANAKPKNPVDEVIEDEVNTQVTKEE